MNNKEVAQKVVDRMLATISTGASLPWVKPWDDGKDAKKVKVVDGQTVVEIPVRYWSRAGKAYNGINPLLLRMYGKRPGEFITFNQCKAEGGHIKMGAKGATIIYWQILNKTVETTDKDGNVVKKVEQIPLLKTFTVFSVEDDCEGLKTKHHPAPIRYTRELVHYEPVDGLDTSKYDPAAESIIADYVTRAATLKVQRDGISDRAYFSPSKDLVVVPCVSQFSEIGEYYSTLFHELGHSTGHASRLNRLAGIAAFGDECYSREELVAEITSASILSMLGLETGNTFRNSTSYVKGWSEAIKRDPMMFITACSRAEKAIDLLLGTETTEA